MKKIFAIFLVFILALSLLTACGGKDINGNNTSDPMGGNSTPGLSSQDSDTDPVTNENYTKNSNGIILSLNKANYAPGEEIFVTVSDMNTFGSNTCVCLCVPDAPVDENTEPFYIDGSGKNWATINAPETEGKYEIRLFSNSSDLASTFVMKVGFTVSG